MLHIGPIYSATHLVLIAIFGFTLEMGCFIMALRSEVLVGSESLRRCLATSTFSLTQRHGAINALCVLLS